MARCAVCNPRKLRRIEKVIGKPIKSVTYRGGHWDKESGHFFTVHCVDGTQMWIDAKMINCGNFQDNA